MPGQLGVLQHQENLGIGEMHRIGYIYSENGMKEEADYYCDKQIEIGTAGIESGRSTVKDITLIMILQGYMHSGGDRESI